MLYLSKTSFLSSITILTLTACGGGGSSDSNTNNNNNNNNNLTPEFTVTATTETGGSISSASKQVTSGDSTSFTITPDDNYEIDQVTGCEGTLAGNVYTTSSISAACEITVSYTVLDQEAPSAKIIFPSTQISRADGNTIIVKGTAQDNEGVQEIRVNGNVADLTATLTEENTAGNITDKTVNWQIQVTAPEDIELIVETEDIYGNIDELADNKTLLNNILPTNFVLDQENARFIGKGTTDVFTLLDLDSEQVSKVNISGLTPITEFVYHESENQTIVVENFETLTVKSVDLVSGQVSVLTHYDMELNPSEWSFANIYKMDIDQVNNDLYMLFKVFSAVNDNHKSIILKFNLISHEMTTVIDDKTSSDKEINTYNFAYSEHGFLIFNSFEHYTNDGISLLALDGSDVEQLTTNIDLNLKSISVDQENNMAYLLGTEGFGKLDLTTKVYQTTAIKDDFDSWLVDGVFSAGLDLVNNRLIVATGYDNISTIDLTAGTNNTFDNNGIGSGPNMQGSRELALDDADNIIYIAEDGNDGSPFVRVFQVDLLTGNREIIFHQDTLYSYFVRGLSLDKPNNSLYLSYGEELISIDIETSSSSVISNNVTGTGVALSYHNGVTYNESNETLLVGSSSNEAIVEIDLSNGHRTIISSSKENMEIGSGVSITGITGITLDQTNQIAYVLSQHQGAVIQVDLKTGIRSTLLDTCMDGNEDRLPPEDGDVQNIFFDSHMNRLLITGQTIISYDIESNTCTPSAISSGLDMVSTESGQIFMAEFNEFSEIDLESGSKVTISK